MSHPCLHLGTLSPSPATIPFVLLSLLPSRALGEGVSALSHTGDTVNHAKTNLFI